MERKFVHTNKPLFGRRKELRNLTTPQEKILWHYLRKSNLGYKFQRQHSFGPYIADFYCAQKKLVIEIDGSHHLDNKEYDSERTQYLTELGYKVLRFWNNEINTNISGVIMKIKEYLS